MLCKAADSQQGEVIAWIGLWWNLQSFMVSP